MFKFFRKIRQDLLTSGSTFKYLKYALGEILLVVIGILIALSINTWNENRKQAITEKEIIQGIKTDLTVDKAYMETVLQLLATKDSLFTILNEEIYELYEHDRIRLDSLLVEHFQAQRTFYPISGSFQSAISANMISKFKNKEFSNAVTKLYNSTYTRIMDNGQNTDARWHFLTQEYSHIRRTGKIPDMSRAELTEFLNDMYNHIFGLNYYRGNLEEAIVEIDAILAMQ